MGFQRRRRKPKQRIEHPPTSPHRGEAGTPQPGTRPIGTHDEQTPAIAASPIVIGVVVVIVVIVVVVLVVALRGNPTTSSGTNSPSPTATPVTVPRFDGTYTGRVSAGQLAFAVTGSTVTATLPFPGSGTVTVQGQISFTTSGDANPGGAPFIETCHFTGGVDPATGTASGTASCNDVSTPVNWDAKKS